MEAPERVDAVVGQMGQPVAGVHRDDDALIEELAASGIAYVPFFPLGGFTPLHER